MGWFKKAPKQPDLFYAASGFYPIALLRCAGVSADFHAMERSYAARLLDEGRTEHQALSARWGGVNAIHQDMDLFSGFVEAADHTGQSMGLKPLAVGGEQTMALRTAASLVLAQVIADAPTDYEEFLSHIRVTV